VNPFARFLRPPVYIGAGAVGAGAATVIVFNMLKWSLLLALLIVLVLVMVAAILILLRQLKKAKQADEIEKSVVVQADKDIERSVPGKQGEMQNLKAEFLAAVERLKTSKRGGKAVLSTLPWYMVVGPSDAGKSVMLSRSGLQFALTDSGKRGRSVKGVGGTKSFEWWLTQEAVLLDMTGRMVGGSSQFEDTGDWGDFLTVLKKQRPEKPLNGVIVVMPLDQLADRPDAQIEKQAGAIRDRIQEVIHHLGVVFPVYVMFTKCDLVAGFAEFFASLGEAEREQPWGATLAVDRASTEAAEALFDAEFSVLQAALADRRMARLPDVPDPLQRARAFAFPAQMERVRPALRRFLRVLFAEDASEKDQPLFRGFYFASGEAQGVPVDRVLEPAARALGASLGNAAPPALPPGAWFVHELLTGVVFEDAGLVTTSKGQAEKQKMGRLLALGLLGIVLLAFVILFSTLSCVNGRLIGDTRKAAEEARTSVRADATLLDNLESLEALRGNVAIVDSLKRHGAPWYRVLGGYSGNPVRDPALDLYTRKAIEALVEPSYGAMQAELDTLTLRYSGEFADLYYTFRSWRLLATPGQLTADDAPLISRVVQRLQAPRIRSMSADVRDRVNLLIEAQIEFLCAHPEFLEKRFFPSPNTYLLARGKSLLAQRWESASFYRLLIDQVRRMTRPIGVAALTDNSRLISGTAEVPGPYTKDGYEKQIRPRVGWWRSQMARDGDLRDAFGGRTPDLAGDLMNAYAADYATQWIALLNGARGADAGGAPATVAENLRLMASDDTPLLALLAGASEQLSFAEDPASPLGRVQSGFAMMHEFAKAPPGGSWGRAVSSAARGLFKKSDPLDRSGLASVRYLDQMKNAQREVADKAKAGTDPQQYLALFTHGGANAVQSALAWLDQQAAGFTAGPGRDATVALLRLPIQMCVPGGGALVPGGGGGIVPPNWNELVFMPFQKTLAGKYPFTAAGPDASVADFTEFYRPGGTFWSYYDANMKAMVKEDGSAAGQTQVRQDISDYVRHAKQIRDAFFAANPAQPTLAFSVRTTTANVEGPQVFVLHVRFDVDGQFTKYSNGVPQWEALQWPGPDPTVGATLRAELAYGVTAESRSFPGPWGLFRLLDQAQWGGTPEAPRVTWKLKAGQSQIVVDYDIQPRGTAHPFRRDFFTLPVPTP
jgi:type VI secretion system protein ImpL